MMVEGGSEDDSIDGGEGDDRLVGGAGQDTISVVPVMIQSRVMTTMM